MFAEDLSVFFDDADGFAGAVSFDGAPPVNCIFDDAYMQVDGGAATTPFLTAPAGSVAAVVYDSTALVGGITCRVVSIEPDGTGLSRVQLRR